MLKMYEAQWCGYCARVRRKMDDLGVEYESIEVPRFKAERKELYECSGQYGIPTLVKEDGSCIADDDEAIITYLESCYGKGR